MGLWNNIQIAWKYRGQDVIQRDEGTVRQPETSKYFENSYNYIEVVRRGVDLIVNAAADIDVDIKEPILQVKPIHEGRQRKKGKELITVLNFRPNEVDDTNAFRRLLFMDYILTGNCFQYYDGRNLYHLPSKLMTIETDSTVKIKEFRFNDEITYKPDEIIWTRDNAAHTIYEGKSRLYSTRDTIRILRQMLDFQETFFENSAVPGLVLQTPNILGDKIKRKLLASWQERYNPKTGGKKPMILDGDLKVNPLSQTKFSELDFEDSIVSHEKKILKALGVPPILLDSGNNANLRPNIQLFYETTVLPMVTQLISSYERFFGYDMEPDVVKVRALRPELNEAANYYQGLVNTGIMTINEARAELRLEPSEEDIADELRIPQNIAGSAENPSEGGRPPGSDDGTSEEDN